MKEKEIFLELMKKKARFLLVVTLFFMIFYFSLPLFIWLFPQFIVVGDKVSFIPWWWIFAFLQFIMTWLLGWIYYRKLKRYDKMVELLKQGNG
ncbi:DUF485 domain-containing protein [Siminovitchia sp. FSL H7-0308]|uniref:Uncharacterized membrane protein (DUF485 family) n=1 Tax=Siminovitchia thermophila TaxID=1245522 RepID=A0ABS2RE43_9BACI|nr:DUF485 domain-containing protein [Siminovitchia thermophila]MBM7717459.1 uncharacterized membrane protein (DUF485 family) [Siminovitchia thermophila]